MPVVGHEAIVKALTLHDLPPVALFLGPSSVGKWTTAETLAEVHGYVGPALVKVPKLTMESARSVSELGGLAAVGSRRLVLIDLDRATVKSTYNVLLKALEESRDTKFILVSEMVPPDTILSRCQVYRFSRLTAEEVEKVLRGKRYGEAKAKTLAALSGGQMRNAFAADTGSDVKATVLSAVRAITTRDADTLDNLSAKWTDDHTQKLVRLCTEAVTRNWRQFQPTEVEGFHSKLAVRVLTALQPDVRPRLAVRSSLMAVLRSIS